MFLMFGMGKRTTKILGVMPPDRCSHCYNMTQRVKVRVTTWFTLFLIPIIPYRIEYLAVCRLCNHTIEIDKDVALTFYDGTTPEAIERNKYIGKTETQISYLKQMDEYRREQEIKGHAN